MRSGLEILAANIPQQGAGILPGIVFQRYGPKSVSSYEHRSGVSRLLFDGIALIAVGAAIRKELMR